jgi:hypothetical protein
VEITGEGNLWFKYNIKTERFEVLLDEEQWVQRLEMTRETLVEFFDRLEEFIDKNTELILYD